MRKLEELLIADLCSDACFLSSYSAGPCATDHVAKQVRVLPTRIDSEGVRAPMLGLTRVLP